MQKDPMIGKTVSQFKIVDYIGGGGMGTVYKAEDTKLKRLVALKFLPMEFTRNPDAKIRFKHEAQAVAALDHPRIGTIFDIIETDDGQMYIVMAYYEGETLGKKMKRGPVQLEEAFGLVLQVANGLAAAHEKGIVHRDIKPANIIITKEGFVKIVDFGLAKLGDSTRITKSGTSMGTPAFMSPEQVKGIQVDHRSDIWSLGVILYELVTGELPFKGDYEHAVMYSILNEEPEPITAFLPEAPGLEKIVKKAIAKNAAERYASMNEFIDDISEVKSLLSEANREDATVVLERKQRSKSGDQKKITPVNQDEIQTMVISDAGKNDPAEKSKRFNFKPVLTGAFVVFMVVLAVTNLSKLSDFFFGADVGYLKITSDPTGAMISLDDETTGKPTPALLGPLKTGAHKISLAAAGFETWSDEFTVIENDTILVESVHLESIGAEPTEAISSEEKVKLSSTLTKRPEVTTTKRDKPKKSVKHAGSLFVDSEPQGAEIILNGKTTGKKTPYEFLEVTPGNYEIRLELAGYEVQTDEKEILGNKRAEINPVLKEAPPGELFVRTVLLLDDRTKQNDTAKIRVFVDGKEIGAPWRPYKLKSGPHKVSAKKEGAYKLRDGEQAVMIESGQRKNVELVFVRK